MKIKDDFYVVSQLYTVPGHILYLGVKYAVLNCEYNFRVKIIVGDWVKSPVDVKFLVFPSYYSTVIETFNIELPRFVKIQSVLFSLVKMYYMSFFRPKTKCFNQSPYHDEG